MVITPSGRRHHGLRRGLVSFWPLNEASGTRADVHGGNDLTDNNTVTQGTGNVYANCADFEATNTEYLSFTGDNHAASNSDFNIALWVNLESKPANNMCLVSRWGPNGTTQTEYLFRWDQPSDRFTFSVFNGTAFTTVTSTFGAPSLATWYFVETGYNASDDVVFISVNGGARDTAANTTGTRSTTGDFYVGAYAETVSAEKFDGLMEALGFWNRALSDAEITSLYNAGSGITYDQF